MNLNWRIPELQINDRNHTQHDERVCRAPRLIVKFNVTDNNNNANSIYPVLSTTSPETTKGVDNITDTSENAEL